LACGSLIGVLAVLMLTPCPQHFHGCSLEIHAWETTEECLVSMDKATK